jgi:hypothetical protein
VGAREERLGENEALFREVNERIAEVAEEFLEIGARDAPVEFNCECGAPDCTEQIPLTIVECEAPDRADSLRRRPGARGARHRARR